MCGCIVALIALLAPRLAIILLWLFSDYLSTAFGTWLWPLLGFFFLPLTTLAYAWSVHTFGGIQGLGLIAVIVAFLIDIGAIGGGYSGRRRYYR